MCMATKSILKSINIRDRKLAHSFVNALSEAEKERYESVKMTRDYIEITGDKIRDFFGN